MEFEKATPVRYHDICSCNKCSGINEIKPIDWIESTLCEAETICKDCGFKDRWGYGFFMSSEDGYDACKKYSNN